MSATGETGDEQATLWNGPSGRAWVETQGLLDQMFTPFEKLLVDAVSGTPARRVLDVGCGTGGTTLAVARRLAPHGSCVGVDISEPMIAAARSRAERERLPATFLCANAQEHAFEPARIDMVISRFGVMFFDDPVRAFANLHRAVRTGGELRFVAWRSPSENPFMTTAERAAAPLGLNLPARRPSGPGQFAFADRDRVRSILEESGWTAIDIRQVDVECTLPVADLSRYLTRLGPVGLALHDADDTTRARVFTAIRPAFDRFVHGDDVRFVAACWMASARA